MFFLVILSEVTVQCVIAIYNQGSSTLLVHFVGKDIIVFGFIIEYSSFVDFDP
jgi:methionyl-tRNA synthetase